VTGVLATLVTAAAFAGVSLLVARVVHRHRLAMSLERRELRFPRGMTPDQVVTALRAIGGLREGPWRAVVGLPAVALEVAATADGIRHAVRVPARHADHLAAQLRAAAPGLRVVHAPAALPRLRIAREFRRHGVGTLPVDRTVAVGASLLASLQPLRRGECLVVQVVVSPASYPSRLITAVEQMAAAQPAAPRPQHARPDRPFVAVLRIGVAAADQARAGALLRRPIAVLRSLQTPAATFRVRRLPSPPVARSLRAGVPELVPTSWYTESELALLVAWPLDGATLPGVAVIGARVLPPAAHIPSVGLRRLGVANHPGMERWLAQPLEGAMQHTFLVGPTGSGKSLFAARLMAQDIAKGCGGVLLDPNGDLVKLVADLIPSGREADVLVIDPLGARLTGFNPLDSTRLSPEAIADVIVATLRFRWAGVSWGPRLQEILWSSVYALAATGHTLVDLPRLLEDAAFRRTIVAQLDEPFTVEPVLAWLDAAEAGEAANAILPVLNKARLFARPALRPILGQSAGGLDLDVAMAESKLVLVSIPKAQIGEDAALALAGLLLSRLWGAILGRSRVAPPSRRPFVVYVDEVGDLLALPASIGLALAQSRKYGVAWLTAAQVTTQIPTRDGLRQEILANSRTKIVFQVGPHDAGVLAKELGGELRAEDLQGLGPREVAMAIALGAEVAPPVTALAPDIEGRTGRAEAVIAAALARHGRPRAEVEAEIRRGREAVRGPGEPIGKRRRRS
jgi:hypothetical protein